MKKLLLFSFCIVLLGSSAFAQRSNVSTAKRLTNQEKPDFAGAREAIKKAIQHESTKNKAKTYYTAGMIGFQENEAYVAKMMLNQKVDPVKKGEAIMESYNYFNKAYKVDQTPNRKGKVKPKFTKRIRRNVKEFYTQNYNLIAYGAHYFDNKKYDKALEVFNVFLEIPKLPYMEGEISMTDSTYRMIKYYTAISATNAGKSDQAIELYTDLLDDDYETKNVYQLLSEEYKKRKDTVNQIKVLEGGFKKYKNDPWFLQNIINIFVYGGEMEKASEYLNTAIAQSPDVAEYYYVKGNVEERRKNPKEALEAFNKAIELNPNMAEAYAGKGRVIYNRAVEMIKAADEIQDNKRYNEEIKKANKVFKEAQPFMEKAVELNPKDRDFKQALKTLYYRVDKEKYDALSKELNQ